MLKKYIVAIFILLVISACSSDSGSNYEEIPTPPQQNEDPTEEEVVNFQPENFPFQTLSEYNFFEGELADLSPNNRVLSYNLISPLFTDYAKKKRFVWMPEGVSATYGGDHEILDFPEGAILIKNFYYNQVQPSNATRIIETRLIYKKNNAWEFANYVWNDQQTEATLDLQGSNTPVEWIDESGETKSTNYRIPSATECVTCHKSNEQPIPIGPKPQNINQDFSYTDGNKNQLQKWQEVGYLESYPSSIVTTVAWDDVSNPLEARVRSYLDINCVHCHTENAHCDYRPIRLAFSETTDPENLGICVEPDQYVAPGLTYIVDAGNFQRSLMHFRMNSTDEAVRMPLLGRTLVHEEGIELMEEWISSLETICP